MVKSLDNRPSLLLPQLAALGYTPADITYLSMSHYHSDHTANANAFAGSTWLVRLAERDMMFNPPAGAIVQQASFSALKTAKAGQKYVFTCRDNEKGEHQAITAISEAKEAKPAATQTPAKN